MDDKKAYLVVVLIQLIYGLNYILCKDVVNGGMPTTIFSFYRLFAASLLFVPFALVFERKHAPRMSWRMLAKIFFLALFGATFTMNIFTLGVKYTSSTVASAVSNAVPVVTFTLAVLLRMESVPLKRVMGIAKILGVLLCLAGVLVLAFYEGPDLNSVNHHRPFLHGSNNKQGPHSKLGWIIGTFIMISFATACSLWVILLGPVLREYPNKLLFSALCTAFGTMQSFFVALVAERDFDKWKLHFDNTLLGVLYTGIIVSALAFYMQTWCIEKKGPVFLAMWQPLSLLITLACSSFFLGETVKLGSVLGGLLMVGGLYSVLWGKHIEKSETEPSTEEEINYQEVPVSKSTRNQDHAIDVQDSTK